MPIKKGFTPIRTEPFLSVCIGLYNARILPKYSFKVFDPLKALYGIVKASILFQF